MNLTKNERGAVEEAVLVLLGLVGLVVLIGVVFGVRWVMAGPNGALDQRERTIGNGQYRIAQYDHFYDLCGAIQATEDKIQNTEASATNDAMTASQKSVILLALRNTRASMIREYNADSHKADTSANFKASDLPYQINVNGESTSCES